MSANVKYRPSANTCSRGGRSEDFAFLMSEGSLLVAVVVSCTVSFENATFSSRLLAEPANSLDGCWAPALPFAFPLLDSGLTPAVFCCFSFCLRSLSSLCTLTGSLSFLSSCRISSGIAGGWSEDSWRKFSTARGMVSSHSLVHWLTYKTNKTWAICSFLHILKKISCYWEIKVAWSQRDGSAIHS